MAAVASSLQGLSCCWAILFCSLIAAFLPDCCLDEFCMKSYVSTEATKAASCEYLLWDIRRFCLSVALF